MNCEASVEKNLIIYCIYLGGLKNCKPNMFNHRVTQRKILGDTQSVNNQIFTSVYLREKLCTLCGKNLIIKVINPAK